MMCNIGKTDRVFRAMFGVALLVSGFMVGGTVGAVMGVVSLVPIVTALVGNCPAYSLFSINTCDPHKN